MIEHLIEDLAKGLGQWAYLLVAALAMAETAAFLGFIAPGEFAIIFGGVLAGEGTLSIELLIGIVWAAVVAGDAIGFLIGRRYGRGFALKHGHRVRLTEERFRRVEGYFERHGGKTIFLGRWVGLVRPLMPFTAGTSGMSYRRFLPYDVLGAGTWSITYCLLGFIFWRSFTKITAVAGKGALGLGIVLVLGIGIYEAVKHLRRPEERARLAAWLERQSERPALRPLAALVRAVWRFALRPIWRFALRPAWRVAAPPLRFAAGRLTPGELGIEFTTLLAVATVSIYVLVLQIHLVNGDSLIAGDRSALDLARDMETGALTAAAKVLSFIGTFGFVLAVVIATSAYLVSRRRLAEAATLAVGFAVAQIAVKVMKEAVERPRPAGGLVGADGWAFPSGHATIAVTYLAIGVLLARDGPAVRRVGIAVAGLALAVLIGLSRIYLQVHYLSDVIGGWMLGLAAFSVCGAVALVVHYLRYSVGGSRAVGARQ